MLTFLSKMTFAYTAVYMCIFGIFVRNVNVHGYVGVCTNLWKLLEMKEVTNCSTYNYTKIETLMNESCKADSLSELVEKLTAALFMLTKPKEDNISACRTDLIKIVQLLEFIVNTTENNPGILSSQNIIQNTADIFSNILSPLNTPGWMELQKINPPFNQKVLLLSERFGFILANEDRSIASDNLLITTKLVNSSSTDVSCNGTGIGLNNSISIPAEFIQERSDITGKTSIPIVTIHYKNIQNILPISTANSTPRFQPVSQVLSSQVTNISDTSSNSAVNLTLQYSLNSSVNLTLTCGFWNFSLNGESGGWDISSVQIIMNDTDNSIITCNSSHLTSFAVLVDTLGGYKDLSDQERRALSIISYIGCIISLFSLLIAIILLIYYRNTLLNGIHSFIHLNLAIALFLALIIFVSGIEAASENDVGCTIVASLLHYFFTAVFTWMLCEGIMLYFLLVKVFNTGLGQRKLFYFTIGWGIPIPIVAISVGVAHDQYGHEEYCWIDYEEGAIWAFVGPMIVIIILNILFLLLALRSLYMIKRSKLESSQAVFVRTILKATVILLPLLGITWVVGILAVNQESSVFAWIFTILNSLQGFFILVFHVIRNEKIWHKISSSWKDNRYRFIIPSSKQTPIDSRITKIKESISTTSNADTKQDADVNTKQEVNIKQEEEVATTTAFLMDITVPSSNNETDL